jgi:transcriptional regulator GlxA family with amidase domain
MTIAKFHKQQRMEKAKQLLLTTDKSIDAIAEATGYNHYSNFLIAYKNHHGYPPGQERRNRQDGDK